MYYFVKYKRKFDENSDQFAYAIYDDYDLAREMYYLYAGVSFGKVDESVFSLFTVLEARS